MNGATCSTSRLIFTGLAALVACFLTGAAIGTAALHHVTRRTHA